MSSEWPLKELELIANEVTVGYVGPMASEYVENGVPFLRSLNIEPFRINTNEIKYVTPEFHKQIKKSALRPGDVAIVRTGKPGTCAVIPDWLPDANCSDLVIVRCGEQIRPRFLCYWVNSVAAHHISSHTVGAVQQHFNVGAAKKMKVAVPDISTQDAVVEVLGSIDDRITLLRETKATLEAIAQALFKSWFVDFDPVRAKAEGRQPEGMDATTVTLFPDSFEESELGLVPKGWRVSSLDRISDVGIGKTPPRKEPQWFSESSNDVQWVSIRDMGASGTFLTDTSEYLTVDAVSRFNVRMVPDNTVLLSFKMTIGRVAITYGEMTTNEAIAHCKITEQSPLSSEYIYLYLRQFDYSALSSTSSIADAVNSKAVKAIPIIVPSSEVASAFQQAVSSIFERIKTIQQQAKTLTQLRDTLLPRLISGQLRMPEAPAVLNDMDIAQ
ncbi:type I restriction enzyme S subunit [Pseudomonas sp. OG7]|uniref:restriction endonuclease subunit S n=1 Tax=Pseudomonas sp. OG7 TaxID=2587037 RepID=UPI00161249C1|nr:restriction endonuclease subunit S [Pseudomonas sp. OG7]MBB3269699.1 type I restriction enzyme S subunit [Pseudomonas sp. OG7]